MNSKMRVLVFLFFVFVSFSFLIYYEYADIVKQDVMQEKNIDVSNENNGVNNQSNSYVIINNYTINVELALTNEERQKGLMEKEILNDNDGMLFIFENEEIHEFWMKNMIISLDIIWINSDGEIVHIEKQVPPCEENCVIYSPLLPAKYVLELSSGSVERLSIESGTEIQLFIKN